MRYFLIFCVGLLSSPALAAPKVATDIAPVHSLVATVMGDLGVPQLLLSNGADPHDFQLRPSQARALADADLVIWVGPEMSPWLDRAYRALGDGAAMLTLLDAPETEIRRFEEPETHGHDGNDHDSPVEHDDHQDHDHSGADPHAWLDPHNAAAWLSLIAAELSRLDPENAPIYNANAVAGQVEIGAMETEIAAQLAPVAPKPFVTFHDAYGYFTGHFGLMPAGSVRAGDAAMPGAAHLSDLQSALRSDQAVCIFPEANHNPQQIAQLAKEGGAKIGGALDPEGVTLVPGPGLYGQLMRNLAATLSECLSRP